VCLAAEKTSCPWPQNLFQPRSSSTSITVSKPYRSSPTKHTPPPPTACHPSTLLKIHSHRIPPLLPAPGTRKRLPRSGFLQVVVSKATATDSNDATNFSSAVASDTTLGLPDTYGDHAPVLVSSIISGKSQPMQPKSWSTSRHCQGSIRQGFCCRTMDWKAAWQQANPFRNISNDRSRASG